MSKKKASPKTAAKTAKRSTKRSKPTESKTSEVADAVIAEAAELVPAEPVADPKPAEPVIETKPAKEPKGPGKLDVFRAFLLDATTKTLAEAVEEFNASAAGPVNEGTASTVSYHLSRILRILSDRGALQGPIATHRLIKKKGE